MNLKKDVVETLKELSNTDKGITIILSDNVKKFISFKNLWNRSCYVAEQLGNYGVKEQHEVIIKCENMELFIYTFWACAISNYISIPLDTTNNNANNKLMLQVLKKADHPIIVSDVEIQNQTNVTVIKINSIYEKILACGDYMDQKYHTSLDDILYVLYSSGTTGVPHGVTITKANVSANSEGFIKHYNINDQDKFISWSPLTHCYGLITFHLTPLLAGAQHCLISSKLYMNQPLIWMDMIHEYKATRIGSLPFALKHFCNVYMKSEKNYNWDISCVKSMFLGGEQVNYDLYKEFCDIVEQYGFSDDKVYPVYGLTEATIMVTANTYGKKAKMFHITDNKLMIGAAVKGQYVTNAKNMDNVFLEMGTVIETVNLSIRDDEFNKLSENYLGQVCISGPCVTSGYYKDKEAGQKVFKEGKWLCTGDIGFMKNGNLFIIGREKELVVANGKKISCALIEDMIQKSISNKKYQQCVVCNGTASSKENEKVIIFIKTDINIHNIMEQKEFLDFKTELEVMLFEKIGLMISKVVPVKEIIKTNSGKVFRRGLTEKYNSGEYEEILNIINENKVTSINKNYNKKMIAKKITALIKEYFHIVVLDYDIPFSEYGIVSVNIPVFIQKLNNEFNIKLGVADIFKYFTVVRLADYIHSITNIVRSNDSCTNSDDVFETNEIAIIGMSCRFPGGANSIDEYWDVLVHGKDGICDIPAARWELEKYYDEDRNAPGKMYCKKGGFLSCNIDEFDARFFNISPKEAVALDPQQRMLLELTWEAFENANLDILKFNGSETGVYVGISSNEYLMSQLYSGDLSRIDAYSLTGGCQSTACGRVSYTFGFEGPCMAIDTACSSALIALHLACTALQAGEADLQVVAGINLIESPSTCIGFSKLNATSADGYSKAFDASANGYGRGEGGGVIILKKLSDALKDDDEILGVIKATGVNQDGKSNGLTAPNGAAQEKLIQKTLKKANLNPLDIDYVEMHGTGTNLGDPIEVNAVAATYGIGRELDNLLKIGSVKSNIGHLESAAGMASIIKVLLSMKHELIPPNLHFHTPNPFIDWEKIKAEVVDKPTVWKKEQGVRRAGINGFGFGGSNAHAIIEECQVTEHMDVSVQSEGINYILKISARSEKSLQGLVHEYYNWLTVYDNSKFEDIIYTANTSRADLEYRVAISGKSREQMLMRMKTFIETGASEGVIANTQEPHLMQKTRKIVFMFTGQGSQYVHMGKLLYDTNDVFRQALDYCDKLFKPYTLTSIKDLIYGNNVNPEIIKKTSYAQPLIFTIEYALCQMWKHYGVIPEIVMGHSIGEYVAAVTADIISLEDAVKLVSSRGRLMDMAPGNGKMVSLFADKETVEQLLKEYKDTVCIAARNAKEICVISGYDEDVDKILAKATKEGITYKTLKVSHAFHSMMMEPILEDFSLIAQEVNYQSPKIRFISCLYGKELEENQILDNHYWTKHIREQVDFYQAVTSIDQKENYLFLEVGSNRVLAALCKLIFGEERSIASTLNIKKEDSIQLAQEIAYLYVSGVNLKWKQIKFAGKTQWRKTKLPNYVYDKNKYWTELMYDRSGGIISGEDFHKIIGQRMDLSYFDNSIMYQSKFTAKDPYFMKEHIIFETAISPAAAHMSMLLSAAKDSGNGKSCVFSNIEFRAPLALKEDEQRTVQLCLGKAKSKFSIISKDLETSNGKWLLHSKGDLSIHNEFCCSEIQEDIESFRNLIYRSDMEQGVYDSMIRSGFKLGDSFRRIKGIHFREEDCICKIEPLKNVPYYYDYILYPGIIDSIFQTGFAFVLEKINENTSLYEEGKKTVIPYYLEKFTYNFMEFKELWCNTKAVLKNGIIYVDIIVYNEIGSVLLKIDNLMAKLTDSNSLLKEVNNISKFYLHTNWVADEDIDEEINILSDKSYLIYSNDEKVSENYCDKIKESGASVISVIAADKYDKKNKNSYMIDPIQKEDWLRLFKQIFEDTGNKDLNVVCCLLGKPNMEKNMVNYKPIKSLLYLFQTMGELGYLRNSKIKIMVHNVHNLHHNKQLNLSASMVWGLAKVFSIEYADAFGGIVDGDHVFFNTDQYIKESLCLDSQEICYRNGKRYVARLISHKEYLNSKTEKNKPINIKENVSYLITGGTGAVGLAYAEQLVILGAKNLIIMCRKEPSKRAQEIMEKLIKSGVNINIVYGDVCDRQSLKKCLNEVNGNMPEVRGVIHAAGVLKDKMLVSSNWSDFETVLNPKVIGTINLYQVIDTEKLDFFIMTSSVASIVGNMGQGSYAAANYFMNCFAYYLEAHNVPGYACCWGAWKDNGMATGNDIVLSRMEKMGMRAFEKEQGQRIIEDFIEQPYTNLVVVDGEWDLLADYYKEWAGKREFLSRLVTLEEKKNAKVLSKYEQDALEILKGLPQEEREDFMIEKLQSVCANIMGFENVSHLSVNEVLREQGADSLMIFSMRTAINKMFNIDINISVFFNYPTIVKLVRYLMTEVLEEKEQSIVANVKEEKDDVGSILSEIAELTR